MFNPCPAIIFVAAAICLAESAPDDGQNEAVFALPVHPRLVFFIGDGQETDVHIQLFGLEEQFFHHLPRVHVADTDKDTE